MIKDIHILHYKKLKKQTFHFSPGINLISGTNGTCKTTLLHIVSNSFQELKPGNGWVVDKNFLRIFRGVNQQINPKMENLTKGDRQYNDPARGHRGNLYGVTYYNGEDRPVEYRRHNNTRSQGVSRYYIKPLYSRGSGQKLPFCPVIYLSLNRLVPYGEYQDDAEVRSSRIVLPEIHIEEGLLLYRRLTNISINNVSTQKMGSLKTRMEFSSDIEGVDSNTISSGEDNISIILNALLSLKYYYESITEEYRNAHTVCSLLLIDEIDATLHPSVQNKLIDLLAEFSKSYKIQVFATTHSLSLLEHALQRNHNVTYLVNNVTSVTQLTDPDIYRIKMHLNAQNKEQVFQDKVIAIYTEDSEARDLLEALFARRLSKDKNFQKIHPYLHMVQVNIGADSLTALFKDHHLKTSTMQAICILDGDRKTDMTHQIVALPGKNSPEKFLVEHVEALYQSSTTDFWDSPEMLDVGYSKSYYLEKVQPDIENARTQIDKGNKEREQYKKLYLKHRDFWLRIFHNWQNLEHNQGQIETFFADLNSMYKKVAPLKGLNPDDWSYHAGQKTKPAV